MRRVFGRAFGALGARKEQRVRKVRWVVDFTCSSGGFDVDLRSMMILHGHKLDDECGGI